MYTPEAILTKANEYVKTGDDLSALEIINEFIVGPKKKNWTHSLEHLINLLVELTVRNDRIKLLKDGLNHYKTLSQHTNIESFQLMLKKTKELVENKFLKAQKSYIVKFYLN
jgi:translation initiation factor 3 subunit A